MTGKVDLAAGLAKGVRRGGDGRSLVWIVIAAALAYGVAADGAAAAERADLAAADAAPAATARIDPTQGLDFETTAHRAWYGVFWTGKCGDLPFLERLTCVKGRPTWPKITGMVVAKAAPDRRAALRARMNRLGHLIGFEWARHNDERRINNDDLEKWSVSLRKSADVNDAIERIADAARRLINRP